MSQRLQVLMDDEEFEEIRAAARSHRLTVAEWVRRALRVQRAAEPRRDARVKLAAIRRAAEYSFPTADIDEMNAEIERGYRQ